jgi:hypothetical protein
MIVMRDWDLRRIDLGLTSGPNVRFTRVQEESV